MEESVYPVATGELAQRRKELAPATQLLMSPNARTASAATRGAALHKGASESELMEAIWVAAEMRAGGAYAHSTLALDTAAHAHGPRAA